MYIGNWLLPVKMQNKETVDSNDLTTLLIILKTVSFLPLCCNKVKSNTIYSALRNQSCKILLLPQVGCCVLDENNRNNGTGQIQTKQTTLSSSKPANISVKPLMNLLLCIRCSLLSVFHFNVQHAVITGMRYRCPTWPDYIHAYSQRTAHDSSSGSNCQPGCFHSNQAEYIIFTLSCCHQHFGLGCSTEHLVYTAKAASFALMNADEYGTSSWNVEVTLKLCQPVFDKLMLRCVVNAE